MERKIGNHSKFKLKLLSLGFINNNYYYYCFALTKVNYHDHVLFVCFDRGLATALACRYFKREMTEDDIRRSYVVGWCVEIVSLVNLFRGL